MQVYRRFALQMALSSACRLLKTAALSTRRRKENCCLSLRRGHAALKQPLLSLAAEHRYAGADFPVQRLAAGVSGTRPRVLQNAAVTQLGDEPELHLHFSVSPEFWRRVAYPNA